MEENQSQKKLYGFLQMAVYGIVVIDVLVNVYKNEPFLGIMGIIVYKTSNIIIFTQPIYTKLFTLLVICLVGVGTLAKKQVDLNVKNQIVFPLIGGLLSLFLSILFLKISNDNPTNLLLPYTNKYEIMYIIFSFVGAILTLVAIDNVSKIIKSGFGKDKWNVEGESFMQEKEKIDTPYSINIPTLFYYEKKVHNGFININPFRGTTVIGTPGSGKSYGIINPTIRQMIKKDFTMCLYDYKFPDLGKIAYYHYCLAKQQGRMVNYKFHVINLNEVEKSNRINPLNPKYVKTLAEASEISEAMVEALKKGGGSGGGGADQFFTQSAINFLSANVYYLAKYEKGRYSSLPHLLAFLNKSYEEIFTILYSNSELNSLLSPFYTAFKNKAFDQLEGQIGTLKIFMSRLATKESFWVFSDDDFDLKISDPETPSILILANDPNTQNINSALYSLVLNRLLKLINSKNNLPTAIIADEVPTVYIHKVENLIATARSNKVAVMMGLQELPQFKQQYGKDAADSINSIVGNILSGSVRNKETLDWLERLFGKVKQKGESLSIDRNKTSVSYNERLDSLIPAGKIASLRTGEMVGIIAKDVGESDFGNYKTSAVNCRINLDLASLKIEEDNYKKLPIYYNFGEEKEEILFKNFNKINEEVSFIVKKIMEELSKEKV